MSTTIVKCEKCKFEIKSPHGKAFHCTDGKGYCASCFVHNAMHGKSIEFFNDESILTQEAINVTTTKCDTVGISLVVNNTEIVLELDQLRLAVSHLEGMIDE